MKRFGKWIYALVLVLSFFITGFAPVSPDIPLQEKADDIDRRSVFPNCIHASFDGTNLYTEFMLPVGEVQIVISDIDKNVILQEMVLICNKQSYSISLSGIPKGSYSIQYYYGKGCLFGEFQI